MSHFKRKQSQVFWKQMESRDLGMDQVAVVSPVRDLPRIPASPEEILEQEENENQPHPLERSSSPGSYVGHRSQDSGFSDSERSEESGVDAYASRVERLRRARTRKSRRRRLVDELDVQEEKEERYLVSGRHGSPWTPSGRPPHPRHTSTPKTSDSRCRKVSTSRPQEARRRERKEEEEDEAAFSSGGREVEGEAEDDEARVPVIGVSMDDEEGLNDFLYERDPPEDVPESKGGRTTLGVTASRWSTFRRPEEELNQHLAPVRSWLSILAMETEAECGATLQSKALPRGSAPYGPGEGDYKTARILQRRDSTLLTASAAAAATKLLARADRFHQLYQSVVEELNRPGIGRSERSLVQSIEEESFLLLSELGAPPPQRVRNLSSPKDILRQLRDLQKEVDRAVDTRLDFYVERIVRGLEEAPMEEGTAARGALAALTVLGLGSGGSRGGRSIARCSGVRALLTTLLSIRGQSTSSQESRAACLRALASVCCCVEAIEQLVVNGGPEILVDLLSTESVPEPEKTEAVALIVQITAPWSDAHGLPSLEPFADDLVRSLTHLAEETSCSQTLLLAAAALNNLAGSRSCLGPMVERKTVTALLKSVKRSEGGSIWLMEQVASLIGELARIPEVHPHLAEARASVALVCFLQMRPPGLESAYRKLEATASAALARLCVHREVAQQVVDVGAANCVVPNQNRNEKVANAGTRYTRSLRIARRRAVQQIDAARASDRACTLDRSKIHSMIQSPEII